MAHFHAVKINLAGAETRRFPAGSLPLHSFAEMSSRMSTEFPCVARNPEYVLSYNDEEGDRVSIGSQAEWEAALDCLRGADHKVPCFTLAPPAHNNINGNGEASQLPPFLSSLLGGVFGMDQAGEGQCGDSVPLFEMFESIRPLVEEMEKNLAMGEGQTSEGSDPPHPFHGAPFPFPGMASVFGMPPSSLCGPPAAAGPSAPTPGQHGAPPSGKACPCNEAHSANLDAVRLMEAKDYEGAEAVLEVAIDRWPQHKASRYNMACAAALGGNPGKALASLREAFSLGYADHPLVATDPDLDPLRELPEFADLLVSLAPGPQGFHMGRYMHRCKSHGRHAQGAAALAALLRKAGGNPDFLPRLRIGARGVVSGVVCAAAVGEGQLGLEALRLFAAGLHAASSTSSVCRAHGWEGLGSVLGESAAELDLMSGLPGYEEFVAEVGREVARKQERDGHHSTHCAHADGNPDEASGPVADAVTKQDQACEEGGAAFPFAREFAEVRETGVAVPDTALRSLLLSHKGDLCAVMSELCATPR